MADKGCKAPADPSEHPGKSWKRLLRQLAQERGVSVKTVRRELRGTAAERKLLRMGMPKR